LLITADGRRALLRADPSTSTVTRLATDLGFWELARFSVAYRACSASRARCGIRRDPKIFAQRRRIAFLNN
jgi:DNA-binding MurR/RpiR family transcriptional regulator